MQQCNGVIAFPQVPPAQLRMLLDTAVDLREPLLEHVQGFTEAQRQHVPGTVMEVTCSCLLPQPILVLQVLYNVPPVEAVVAAEAGSEGGEGV